MPSAIGKLWSTPNMRYPDADSDSFMKIQWPNVSESSSSVVNCDAKEMSCKFCSAKIPSILESK